MGIDLVAVLSEALTPDERGSFPSVPALILRLVFAFILGCVIAAIYRYTQKSDSPATSNFVATLVMMCILLAVLTKVIGESQALAFSLVGILSIVRFRTVVDDTRETAFVVFAVIVGMACGVGNLTVAMSALGVGGAAATLFGWLQRSPHAESEWILLLRVSTSAGGATPWEALFTHHCDYAQLQGTATTRQGAALELTYKLRLKPGVAPLQLLNEINRLEGIQNLELKRG
jgi:hypothetical protein